MSRTNRCAALLLCLALATPAWAVDSRVVQCVGGTASNLPKGVSGNLDANAEDALRFRAVKGVAFELPYSRITSMEYGQNVGEHVAEAILISPLFLLAKSRKHFLTIYYTDTDNKPQASIWQLGDDVASGVIMRLQLRTGQKVIRVGEQPKEHHP